MDVLPSIENLREERLRLADELEASARELFADGVVEFFGLARKLGNLARMMRESVV